jgi:hypothetical protein
MSEEKKRGPGNPAFHKGMKSLNPEGRPVGAHKPHKRSRLRVTESKLMKLNAKALENIEKSVNGEEVDKEVLNTSKWVVDKTVMVSKAAMQEEIEINGLKAADKKEMEDIQSEEETGARFSLDLIEDEAVPYNLDNLPTEGSLQ